MRVVIVAAIGENGVIGRDGRLPWRLPADLKRFKELTMGRPMVMGRKTWDSIGRPLPGRRSLVLSRDPDFAAPGATVVRSAEEALLLAEPAEELMVIGGGAIYTLFLPLADRLELTRVHVDLEGDAHFPPFDPHRFIEVSREERAADPENPHRMTFIRMDRA